MRWLTNLLFPGRYDTSEMLTYYLRAQYGPYLVTQPTDEFEEFYANVLAIAKNYIQPGTKALDVGCATGRLVFEYAQLGASHSVGTDLSKKFIDYCTQIQKGKARELRYSPPNSGTTFLVDDICKTNLSPYFQFISCINVLDRVDDPRALMDSLLKLLSPDGILLMVDPYDWELSTIPKQQQTNDMKELLNSSSWNVLEETRLPFKIPTGKNSYREYECHVVIAKKS